VKAPVTALAAALCLIFGGVSASSADQYTKCELRFSLKGWSFIYKTTRGTGRVICDNGQSADVTITTHAAGISAGKSEIEGGEGTFSAVRDISEIYGSYFVGEAHAGATRSVAASVMTKGEVSLAISGQGRGVDLGLTLGAFTIE